MINNSDINLLIDAVKSEKINTLQSCIAKIESTPTSTFPETLLADLTAYADTLNRVDKMKAPVYGNFVSKALSFYFWIIMLYFLMITGHFFAELLDFMSDAPDFFLFGCCLGVGLSALVTYFLLKSHFENQFKQAQYLYAVLKVLHNGLEDDVSSKLVEQKAYLLKELEEWRSSTSFDS